MGSSCKHPHLSRISATENRKLLQLDLTLTGSNRPRTKVFCLLRPSGWFPTEQIGLLGMELSSEKLFYYCLCRNLSAARDFLHFCGMFCTKKKKIHIYIHVFLTKCLPLKTMESPANCVLICLSF